jgi:hypothetical protein
MILWWVLRHYCRVIKHKWFVLLAGHRMFPISAPYWRLLIHDWTKFMPSEAKAYAKWFYGKKGNVEEFSYAWLHHQNYNSHHWEHWISRSGHNCDSDLEGSLDMPTVAIIEMVADWFGASRNYTGNWPTAGNWPWFYKNWPTVKERLSNNTLQKVELLLKIHVKGLIVTKPTINPFAESEELRN